MNRLIRKHLIFSGMVQGVGFRSRAIRGAKTFGLTGWVKNLPDGRVEMEVQGYEFLIDELIEYVDQSSYIDIVGIESREVELKEETAFSARY